MAVPLTTYYSFNSSLLSIFSQELFGFLKIYNVLIQRNESLKEEC